MTRRMMAGLLAVMMLITMVPVSALAADGEASLTIENSVTYDGSAPAGVTLDYDVTIGGVTEQISLASGASKTYSGLADNVAYTITQREYDNASYALVPAETRTGELANTYRYVEDGNTVSLTAAEYAAAVGAGINDVDVVGYYDGGTWKTDQVVSSSVTHKPAVFYAVPKATFVSKSSWGVTSYKATYTYGGVSYVSDYIPFSKEGAALAAYVELNNALKAQYYCQYTNKDTVVNLYERVTTKARTYSYNLAVATETFATVLTDAPTGSITVNYAVFNGLLPASNDVAKFDLFTDGDTLVGSAGQSSVTIPFTSYGYTENKFSNISSGNYYIKQNVAATGYKLDDTEYTFSVNRDGAVNGDNIHDGVLYNKIYNLITDFYLFRNGETATVIVNKDETAWSGLVVALHGDGDYTLEDSSGSYSNDNVYAGDYNIFIGGADTDVDISVKGGTSTATVNYYTVTYNENNGGADTEVTPYLNGAVVVAGQGEFTNTGYNFAGWNTQEDGNGTPYSEGDETTITAATTLHAQWTAKTTEVALDANGGVAGEDVSVTATYGAVMPNLNGNLPTKTNHSFNGYFDAQTDGEKYYDENGLSAKAWDNDAESATLYAQWIEDKYAVTVTNGTGDGEYFKDVTVTIIAAEPMVGKQFKEWTTTDGVMFANAADATTTFCMPASAVAVTATYEDIYVTGIDITTQPMLIYNEGEMLDLRAIVITVTYSDDTTEDCAFGVNPTYGGEIVAFSIDDGTTLFKSLHDTEIITVTVGGLTADTDMLEVKSTNANVSSVSVEGTAGTVSGTIFSVILPYGTSVSSENTVVINTAEPDAIVSNLVTADDGTTWTFTVTAQDTVTVKNYTINVSVAPNPAAGNIADVASAKETIEEHDWIVAQETANTPPAVLAWIEQQLGEMNLNGVTTSVTVFPFTAAIAGTLGNNDGTRGGFGLHVALSKGAAETLAEDIASEKGIITATPYIANPTVTVSTDAVSPVEFGATVTLTTEIEDILNPEYQWYINKQNSTSGGMAVFGETEQSFAPDTRAAVTNYYYCDVNGTKSNIVEITVEHGFKVTYDANDGLGASVNTNEYAGGDTVNVAFTPVPTRTEYTFKGWATSADAAVPDYANDGTTTFEINGNTTLYAVWELNTYALNVVNGTDITNDGPYAKGIEVSIVADAPSAEQIFDKWTTANGGTLADANSMTTTYTMPGTVATITAIYKDKPVQYGLYCNDYPAGESAFTVNLPFTANGKTDVAALKIALFNAAVDASYCDASGETVMKAIAGLGASDVDFTDRLDVIIGEIYIPLSEFTGVGTHTIKCVLNNTAGYTPDEFIFEVNLTDTRIDASISLPAIVEGSFDVEMPDLAGVIRNAVIGAINTVNSVLPAAPEYTVAYKSSLGIWIPLEGVGGIGDIGKGTHEIRVTLAKSETHTSAQAYTSVTVSSKGEISINYAAVEYTIIEGTQVPTPTFIAGAEFALYNADGTLVGITATEAQQSIPTTDYGYEKHTFPGILEGSYYIKQTVAPEGYKLDETEYHFTVNGIGEITAPEGTEYIKTISLTEDEYFIGKKEYIGIPLFDNEKVLTSEGLYRNAAESYTVGLPIDGDGAVIVDTLKAAIFDAVVDGDYTAFDENDDIVKAIEGLDVSGVRVWTKWGSVDIYSELNGLIREGTYSAKISLANPDGYYPNEITFELVIIDNRINAEIVLSDIGEVVYSADTLDADITAAVQAAIDESSELPENPVLTIDYNIGTDDIPIWNAVDDSVFPMNAGTHKIRVRSEGTSTHTAGETFAEITVVPAPATITVNSMHILYGEAVPDSLVVTDPETIKKAVVYVGVDIDADPYVSVVLPDNISALSDPVLWGLKQLLNFQEVSVADLEDALEAAGVSEDILAMIFENIPDGVKNISVSTVDPSEAGVYLVVAFDADKNYEASPAFGVLAICINTEGNELRWNEEIDNYFINASLELDGFDFTAAYYVDDVENITRTVQYKYFGIGRDGADYSETPPTNIGVYTQVAYVDIDDEMALPIVRAFVVGNELAEVDVANKTILVGEDIPQMVTTDPEGLDTLMAYAGINDDMQAFLGIDTHSQIGEMLFEKLNGVNVTELRELLADLGISIDAINKLFALLPENAGTVTVVNSAPGTDIAGVYMVGAMVIENGYLPVMDIGALAVMKNSENVELRWNEEIDNYFINVVTELDGFDFDAACYVDGEESVTANVKYRFFGAGFEGADFTTTPPTAVGAYTEVAYIFEDDIMTLPIVRTFVIGKDAVEINVANETILVGEDLPQMVTTVPEGLNTLTIYAGVNDDAQAFIGIVYPEDADSIIGDKIFAKLNGMDVTELRELLAEVGVRADVINKLFALLPENAGTLTVVKSAPSTDIAGTYIVGAMVIEDAYLPVINVGALAVMKKSENVELRWNEEVDNYFINVLTELDDFDFTAACFVEGEESTTAIVKYKYFGVGHDGVGFTDTPPTALGAYTQIAYVIEDDIVTLPITRTFAIVDDSARISVASKCILVGDQIPQMVTTDPAGLDTLTVYVGINDDGQAFVGIEYPEDADSLIGEKLLEELNNMDIMELREALEAVGVPANQINGLFSMLPENIGTLAIVKGAPDTDIAGAYIVGAMVIEDGYLPTMRLGALAVVKEIQNVEFRWNQEVENGEIAEHIIARGEFDFSATATVNGVEAEDVKDYFVGITAECQVYNSTYPPTVPGTYAQLAVFSNDSYTAVPLLRTFEVIPSAYFLVTVNHGSGDGSYVEGEPVTITAEDPEVGKKFKEWTIVNGEITLDDVSIATTTFPMPAEDVQVTATYEDITYIITYDANGGTETMEDGEATCGVEFTLPECGFMAPEGETFKAWSIFGTEYNAGDSFTFTADTNVRAVWGLVLVDSITVTSADDTVVKTETLQMNVSILPADADDKSYTWSVENSTGEASIDDTGLLTGTKVGTVTVKATADDGSGVVGSKEITITPLLVSSIMITSTSDTVVETKTLEMSIFSILPEAADDKSYTWSIENGTGEASIDEHGVLTGTKVGAVTVKATASDGSDVVGSKVVTVTPNIVTGVTLSSNAETITIGDTIVLVATVEPEEATYPEVTWSTSDESMVTVDQSGNVTAVGIGTAIITVKTEDGNFTDTCIVTVYLPGTPTSVRAISASYNSIAVSWDAVAGADGYSIYRATKAFGPYKYLRLENNINFIDSGLTTGQIYYYRIRSYSLNEGTRVYGAFARVVAARPVPAAPSNFTITDKTYTTVSLTWDAVAGGTGYRVYRLGVGSSTFTQIADISATSYINTGLKPGTTYTYKVIAYHTEDGKKIGGYQSNTASEQTLEAPSVPTSARARSASYTSIGVSWDAVDGVDGYSIYRATKPSGPYKYLRLVQGTSFVDTDLTTGRIYYYRVRSYVMDGSTRVYSTFARAVAARAIPVVPTNFRITDKTYTTISMTWDAVPNATGYRIFRKSFSSSTYVLAGDTTSTSYEKVWLKPGTTYTFRVVAYRTMGSTKVGSYPSNTATEQTLAAAGIPTSIQARSASYNSIVVRWDAVNGADGYNLFRATKPTGPYTYLRMVSDTSFVDTALATGQCYYYRVRSYIMDGSVYAYGIFAPAVAARPVPAAPIGLAYSNGLPYTISVGWRSVSGSSGYQLWCSTSENGTYTFVTTTPARAYTHTGLESNRTYYYKVRAYRMVGTKVVYGNFSTVLTAQSRIQ